MCVCVCGYVVCLCVCVCVYLISTCASIYIYVIYIYSTIFSNFSPPPPLPPILLFLQVTLEDRWALLVALECCVVALSAYLIARTSRFGGLGVRN